MYENSAELAENKLLVLYVIQSLKQPISKTQLTEIILENNFINYFTLQQYISELESSEFVGYVEKNNKKLITITKKGELLYDPNYQYHQYSKSIKQKENCCMQPYF